MADRGGDGMLNSGEVVESLLDEETDDAIRVEDEVGTLCVLVADNPEAGLTGMLP